MPSALDNQLDGLSATLATRLQTLAPNVDSHAGVLIAKAVEALRGSTTMQGIVAAGDTAVDQVAAALAQAIASAGQSISASQAAATTALTNAYNGLLAELLAAQNAIAPRIGDVFQRLIPDPAQLPGNCWVLDGAQKVASLCPQLVAAWFPGGVACPMIANYNATNPFGATVQVVGGNITLPNMLGGFFRNAVTADHGKYFLDKIGGTNNFVQEGALPVVGKLSDSTGTGPAVGYLDGQTETTPKYYAALPLVRFS